MIRDHQLLDAGYDGPLAEESLNRMVAGNFYESLTDVDLDFLVGRYDGALRWVDDELGRLFDHMQARGLYDDALIVITADHGEEFLEHGGLLHGLHQHREVLAVPLLVVGPGVRAGSLCSRRLNGGGPSLSRTRLFTEIPDLQGKYREIVQILASGEG